MALILPQLSPATTTSPTFNVPFCTKSVAIGPVVFSNLASTTVPMHFPLGFALINMLSATNKIVSSRSSRPCFVLAETGTTKVSPSHSSGCKPISANCRLTRSGLASDLSILLSATIIGTFAALAWLAASRVCGCTPSSAATTNTTISAPCAPRARIDVNAA